MIQGSKNQKQKSTYAAQQIKGFYRYRPKQKFNFLGQPSYFIWSNRVEFYQQQIQNKSEHNFHQLKFDSSFSILQTNRWFFDLRFRGRYHTNNDRTFTFEQGDEFTTPGVKLTDHSVQISFSIPFEKSRIKIGLERKKKAFNHINSHNNSNSTTPWLEYAINVSGTTKLHLGARYRKKDAKDPYNSYNNKNLYASLIYYPNKSFNASLSYNHNKLHYVIDDPFLVNWSTERRKSLTLGLKYHLKKNIKIGLNSHFIKTNKAQDNGEDQWYRVESYISYRF